MGRRDYEDDYEDEDDEMDEEEETPSSKTYMIEKAKSGRSQCRGCGSNIANRELRVGIEEISEYNDYPITRWYHALPNCIRIPADVPLNSISGYSSLSSAEKSKIQALSSGSASLPSPTLPSVTPNSFSFAAPPPFTVAPTVPTSLPSFTFTATTAAPFVPVVPSPLPPSAFNFVQAVPAPVPKKKAKSGKSLEDIEVCTHDEAIDTRLKEKVERNGGIYSVQCHKDVTHCISDRENVSKGWLKNPNLWLAISRRIPIVSEAFLDEATRTGRVPAVDNYLLWNPITQTVAF